MNLFTSSWQQARYLLRITRSQGIVRRYFVVNGFDGALTMLGILSGSYVSGAADLTLVLGACFGAAIALGMSGISSAYISEVAERRKALADLERAMASDLSESAHGRAARWVPVLIGAVNGLAPLCICLLIMLPLLVAQAGALGALSPLPTAITLALLLIFLLGSYLGKVAESSVLLSGLKSLLVGLCTLGVILLLG